ncbi:glycosyltransferase family 4 protein [Methanoculleus sp. FWC-SCC1]|uniref:Glycosyltransferase family 4 protein n=1 Tax=Methanoculleus frigidifontis TaxID=2584085 RepID=A0ABT8M6W5_9EURY|nr:glycosyltransferase family 4 protein [Methanoculleus sp. FWC-SCC1]MDN7023672.1 glycosyltransferase family 4 protein [Methanoculleus sp. FWC-SCC1]
MESLKIAFFCWESLYSERVGGLANAATHLAETLARDHEIHFFTRGTRPSEEIGGVHYHYCNPWGNDIIHYCANMSHGMVDRFRELDTPSFDVLHFHDWHVVEAMHLLQERDTVFTYHSTEYGRSGNTFGNGWAYREISAKEWYGGLIARRVTAVSATLRSEAMHLYNVPEWKIDVVPNGVVPQEYRAIVNPDEVKTAYGIDPGTPLILFVGRLAWQKGPDILVDAVPTLLEHQQDGQIVFVGDGHMRPALEARSSALPVRFLGHASDADHLQLLNAADVVVIPSRNEPFGLVLLEAWSAERCVVASDVGGLAENIEHGTDGVKASPQPESIAEGLISVAGSPDRIAALGREGRRKVDRHFRWETIGATLTETYKKTGEKLAPPC